MIRGLGYEHLFEPEPWFTNLLLKLLDPQCNQDHFVDIGVNTGQTLLKVKSINKSIRYVGFEPNPNCLFYLYALLHCNDLQHVTIFPFALSDKSGIVDLDIYTDNATDSSASIVPGFRSKSINNIKVPAINGAEVPQFEMLKLGVVKIDVEGGELGVIRGILSFIQRDRPIVICEVLPVYHVDNVFRLSRQNEVESILKNASYKIARIDSSGKLQEISSIGVHSDINMVNYLFFPEEKREALKRIINPS